MSDNFARGLINFMVGLVLLAGLVAIASVMGVFEPDKLEGFKSRD
jgi:hypothetical protein